MACPRPKAPVGRFLDASGAALGRFLAHLGRLLGGSWAVWGTKLRRPRASWRHLGGVLEEFWRPLGPSWAIQRILEGTLDRLGGVMEASWAGKVANMAPTWPQVGAQNGGKIRLGPSWRRLGSLLEASCSRFYAFLMHF